MTNEEEKEVKLRKDLLSAVLNLVVKIVGETVKDKMARAIVVSLVAGAGYYFELPPVAVDVKPVVPTPAVTVVK